MRYTLKIATAINNIYHTQVQENKIFFGDIFTLVKTQHQKMSNNKNQRFMRNEGLVECKREHEKIKHLIKIEYIHFKRIDIYKTLTLIQSIAERMKYSSLETNEIIGENLKYAKNLVG